MVEPSYVASLAWPITAARRQALETLGATRPRFERLERFGVPWRSTKPRPRR